MSVLKCVRSYYSFHRVTRTSGVPTEEGNLPARTISISCIEQHRTYDLDYSSAVRIESDEVAGRQIAETLVKWNCSVTQHTN